MDYEDEYISGDGPLWSRITMNDTQWAIYLFLNCGIPLIALAGLVFFVLFIWGYRGGAVPAPRIDGDKREWR